MDPEKSLFLLDGTALAYRSHFAFAKSSLTSPDGKPTGAAFGYAQTLHKLLERDRPARAAVAFDGPKKTFRHALLPSYKATREKTPPELVEQIPWIKEITERLGLATLEEEGVEADDVIGTLARRGEESGLEVYIVSGDKDFAQLVSPGIKIYNILSRSEEVEVLDPKGVEAKWGVPPEKFQDFLALVGDASDNIPGVPGVGPKTAAELIRLYGDLEGILARGSEYKRSKIAKALVENADQARLAKELVRIRTDLDLPVDPKDLQVRPVEREALKKLYLDLGFHSLLPKLMEDAASREAQHDYRTVQDEEGLSALEKSLREAGEFVVDTETTALDPMRARVVGISFSTRPGLAWYVPLLTQGAGWREKVLERLGPLLSDPSLAKIGQNIKYDMVALSREGVEMEGVTFDTMVASYCVAPEERQHGLDALSLKYLNYRKIPTSDLLGKGRKKVTMDQVTLPVISRYACEDADYTGRLVPILKEEMAKAGVETLFYEFEMPLVPVLMRMEREGIRLDTERLARLSKELEERIEKIEGEIAKYAGREINLRSPQQVSQLLFEKLELHKIAGGRKPRKMKTGAYSTDASVLESLAPHHPVPALLLQHREVSKLKSTYVDALGQLVHPETGRVHTHFNQTVTATGRLSSSDPNLQNIPIRTEEGRKVRACFVPRKEGWKLLSLDYSQVELRVMAHFSGDENLVEAFRQGKDIHRRTAALILGKAEEEVTPAERTRAKVVNFGILYGMGPRRLARETGMSVKEASEFIERYFAALPGVKAWLEETLERARREKQVTTIFGRRRRLPEILSPHERIRAGAENMAVNTPIQGSAADIMKKAMVEVDRAVREEGFQGRMVLQVHDELLFDCPAGEVEELARRAKAIMEGVVSLQVPLKADVGWGDDWLQAHS